MFEIIKRFFGVKEEKQPLQKKQNTKSDKIAIRKGELGEYKIDIQLAQLPKDHLSLSDLMISNSHSRTGYSQIDHVIITPYGVLVIETKNYQGTIYGGKDRKTWLINGKFKMMNPLTQNYGHIQALKKLVKPEYRNMFYSFVTFTKRCTLKVDLEIRDIKSDEVVLYDLQLTEYINRKVSVLKLIHKQPLISHEEMKNIYETLLDVNIIDPIIREKHVAILKEQSSASKDINENKCSVCGISVSEKVKRYCNSDKRFEGKIFCYKHQKNVG
ncbi:nuclease-related domain-containing protein [Bacillus infantis]|uniref:nuclease-related domain-containing protein n=1 Tax=Bacillus infantis TaxID=324767 RepID=UPI003CF4F256